MKTLNLAEAASFLKMSSETLRRKVQTGEIPATKTAKGWVFLDDDLALYIRSNYHVINNIYLKQNELKNNKDLYPKNKLTRHNTSVSYMSQRKIEKEYEKLMMSS